ncbi:hypothetical protein Pint_20459 [Pistacia integerrima]|uniref:Uncharacterized protein n=1 Tax=Pistacia integerrima TaxID=434235 RepID=A0ACC0XCB0_9ROSI|nr:hypothetical protein Pint_20459 [Pistacia integerrima]
MGQSSSQLQPGDHITTDRSMFVNYDHHGIYVGDDVVIHFLQPAKKSNSSSPCQKCGHTPSLHGEIVKTCLDCFLDGHSLYIINPIDCKPPNEVVKTATEFFQGIRTFDEYNFFFNNCQDFASFCKTGIKSSEERNKVVKILSVGTKEVTKVSTYMARIGMVGLATASALQSVVNRIESKNVDGGIGLGRNGKNGLANPVDIPMYK